jgi:hypothetical protein
MGVDKTVKEHDYYKYVETQFTMGVKGEKNYNEMDFRYYIEEKLFEIIAPNGIPVSLLRRIKGHLQERTPEKIEVRVVR